ncbi:efflux RND transporter periplasmic adaptor subunit [Crocinitomicaceae bacterium]|nr:efflux RND transporter periplasmic adaptor subunit [Crocinitomicaceae bacterium]
MKKTSTLGLILLIIFSCSEDAKKNNEAKKENLIPLVAATEAQNKSFSHKIKVQGNVSTDKDILLNSEMSGLITQMHVSSGNSIKKGQVILSMDESIINANIIELKSQLDYANYMLGKQVDLFEKELGTELDKKTAENQVNSLEAKLKTLEVQKSKMIVTAPFSGTIDEVFAKTGQLVAPQMPILRLVNNKQVEITASVSEKHFKNVKKGTELRISFPNYDLESMNLKVKSVGNFIEPTNRTFTIRTEVNNNTSLMPNMLAEVEITDLKIDSGLVIPSKSILKNQNNNDYVWVLKNAKKATYTVEQVFINTITTYNGEALIEDNSSINAGTLIIESGARGITKKDIVRIK